LTKGEPSVTDVVAITESDREVLRSAAIAEKGSEHPLGYAIIKEAEKRGIDIPNPDFFESIPGHGVVARHNGNEILLGNRAFMRLNNVPIEDIEKIVGPLEEDGKTVMFLAMNRNVMGAIAVADTLKEHSLEAVKQLKEMGLEIIMLSGDNEKTANAIGRKLGINRVIAEVLPADKAKIIKNLQGEGKMVAMVGDGINDAPALAQADVGIAIGGGTDVAKEVGGIILIKDDLRDVVTAIQLSKSMMGKIKQNLFWAFFYNIAFIPVAAGALYPIFHTLLNPIFAAIAMAFSSVTVVTNSLLLRRFSPKRFRENKHGPLSS
jgi:Cu+-exporting ATPase